MNNSSELEFQDPGYKYMIIINLQITLYAVVFLLGLIGNALVIYVVFRYRKLQTITNTYLLNLAIADELFLVGIPFLIVTILKRQWIFGSLICKTYMILTSINQFASSLFLLVISADRYLVICHSIYCQKFRTKTVSKVVSFVTWSWSLLSIVPIIRYSSIVTYENTTSCVINWDDAGGWREYPRIFTFYTFFSSFAVPLSFILVFYFLIVYKLIVSDSHADKTEEKLKTNRRVTKMVLIVVTVYVVCLLPYWIMQMQLLFKQDNQYSWLMVYLHLLASALLYTNSAINPILYAFLSKTFCKSFLRVCVCKLNKKQPLNHHPKASSKPKKAAFVVPNRKRSIFVCENNGVCPSMSDAQPFVTTLTVQSSLTNSEESLFCDDNLNAECCNNVPLDTTSL